MGLPTAGMSGCCSQNLIFIVHDPRETLKMSSPGTLLLEPRGRRLPLLGFCNLFLDQSLMDRLGTEIGQARHGPPDARASMAL